MKLLTNQSHNLFEIIKEAKTNPTEQIEVFASDIHKSVHISPQDACLCTNNCGGGSGGGSFLNRN